MSSWVGSWVAERTGISYEGHGPDDARSLAGLALRRNHKRLLLVVSTVLGKHIPASPVDIADAAHRLGAAVAELRLPEPVLVIGFAETATALGHGVAEMLGDAHYLHSTRTPSREPLLSFFEEHSHATAHHLAPTDADLVRTARSIVLVDDEISTGRTSMNIIRELSGIAGAREYVVASLLDSRPDSERAAMSDEAVALGLALTSVTLSRVRIGLPDAAPAVIPPPDVARARAARGGDASLLRVTWPPHLALDGQDGLSRLDRDRGSLAAAEIAARILTSIGGARRLLVVGIEEFMAVPQAIAMCLAARGLDTLCCSTTRSPVSAIDEDGYAIRSALEFVGDPDQADYPRFLYNVKPDDYDVVIVVSPETGPYAASRSLVSVLASNNEVIDVRIGQAEPLTGPRFSSYPSADVRWLLTDISDVGLESSGLERERVIQLSGHYSESLPVEFSPGDDYLELFEAALATQSRAVAVASARLAEQVLAARGEDLVLVSLARAGTPAGVLVRRWLEFAHGLRAPHYTMSILLDRGLDRVALDYLRAHHDPALVAFVDGWTGKGSISAELRRSLADLGAVDFSGELGVLADPAAAATWSGTDDDVLIPSACLNSTVSGLISRTAASPAFLPEGRFHGAKFYSHLAAADRSVDVIEHTARWFPDIDPGELVVAPRVAGSRSRVIAEIARLRERYGVQRDALIKPGLCEATRVLLRRVPELLVVRELGHPDARHLELLAATRGTPVVVDPESLFAAVGVIRSMREPT